jgi:hypothetical protein
VNFLTGAKLQLFNDKNEHFSYLETFKPTALTRPGTPIFPTFAETRT